MKWRILLLAVVWIQAACGATTGIQIRHALIAEPAGSATAAYFEIVNNGEAADRLTGVRTEVGSAELHRSFLDGGRMHMEPVLDVSVGGGEVVAFEPGGFHVMLLDVDELEVGQTVALTLIFEVAGEIQVEALVKPYAEIVP